MFGVGFCINDILDDVLSEIEIINIENPLYPNYLNEDYKNDVEVFLKNSYDKTIIVDGAYIDLNPGTSEKAIREIVRGKVQQSVEFAISVNSDEIIFLSTFLPMIGVDSYVNSHIDNSISFWKDIMSITKNIRVSLCNTFEYDPNILLTIANGVNCNNFGLAFDVGHAFAYSKTTLRDFFRNVEPYCKSVYLHSNKRNADEHLDVFDGDLLKSGELQEIIPLLKNKNIILKLFDKTRIFENINILKPMFTV